MLAHLIHAKMMKLCKVVIVLTCFQTRKPQLREVKQFGKFVKMANLEREGVQPPCTPPPLGRGYMTWGRCDLEQRKWHLTLELAPRPGFSADHERRICIWRRCCWLHLGSADLKPWLWSCPWQKLSVCWTTEWRRHADGWFHPHLDGSSLHSTSI